MLRKMMKCRVYRIQEMTATIRCRLISKIIKVKI
jgi:hypothetical protein